MRTRAVLFDWRGILVVNPPEEWWIGRAFEELGRPKPTSAELADLVSAITEAGNQPAFVAAEQKIDCSAELHAETSLAMFAAAGLDEDLAIALYQLDFRPDCHPYAIDAKETFESLASHEIKIAVISDIHFDLRPEFEDHGLSEYVDEFVLSFEHGIQKPDPAIFRLALDALQVRPTEALMVGDRPSHDGGAVAVGIPTLLLPTLGEASDRRLELVLRVGIGG
jgi:HAD superfamily hydrolase (TIGR01549 family)